MAFGTKKSAVQSIDDEPDGDEVAQDDSKKSKLSGPPPATPKPRSASDSSLFSSVGRATNEQSQAGLGGEGADPNIIGMQGLTLVQRGLQMLNLAFPDNPGLVAVLADITGRLQQIVPQLVAGSSGSMGMFGSMMGQIMPGMGQPGMGMPGMQPGMPPSMAPPPMGGIPAGPPMGGPMGAPPNAQMPPVPPGRPTPQ